MYTEGPYIFKSHLAAVYGVPLYAGQWDITYVVPLTPEVARAYITPADSMAVTAAAQVQGAVGPGKANGLDGDAMQRKRDALNWWVPQLFQKH